MDCPFCGKPLVRHTRADLYHCVLMIGETHKQLLEAGEELVNVPVGETRQIQKAWNKMYDAITKAREVSNDAFRKDKPCL